jgi:hypothetical protein
LFTLRWGAMLMCGTMNIFYGLKALTNNEPISFEGTDHYQSIRETIGPNASNEPVVVAERVF